MNNRYIGNYPNLALQVVADLYPKAKTRVVNDGQENLIIIVDEKLTVRFPRTEEVWDNGRNERFILQKLSSFDIPTPRIISVSTDPAFTTLSYRSGNNLTTSQIRSMSQSKLHHIGKQIAEFAYELHSKISPAEIAPFLVAPSWTYDDYLKRVLLDRQDPNPMIDKLAKRYYNAWKNREKKKQIVVHDDLHTGNLLFNDDYDIVGVLDFGAVCLGTPEQELRQIYRFGDYAFEIAASRYEELSGQPFDRELAKLWAITQELGTYCREDSKTVHERAAENLRFWFPDLDI